MRGQILDYSIQSNSGVISGTDGGRYTFVGSEWKADVPPSRGLAVDFDVQDKHATSIYRALSGGAGAVGGVAKNRLTYIVLAIFLGSFGIHNFYAGYNGRGVAQLLITLFLGWLVLPWIATVIWSIVEVVVVTHDAKGIPMN